MIHKSRRAALLLVALAIPAAIVTAAPSAFAAPSVDCIQNPTTNSNITEASFLGADINIRTGPFIVCTAVGEGQPSDQVTVHCRQRNSKGVFWDYLTDRTTGKKGWSKDVFVGYPRTPATCR